MRTLAIRNWDDSFKQVTFAELLSQVTALCAISTVLEKDAAKRSDLRKRKGAPRARPVLIDPADRIRKLGIETGWDARLATFRTVPLEPWTCPVKIGERLYGELMRGSDGASLIGDYEGDQLTALEWMRDEELVSFGEAGEVHALGDASPRERRTYPGAPVSDKKAAVGHQLRDRARKLAFAAWVNIVRRRTKKRISPAKRAGMDRPNGVCIAAYDVCAEANAIKAKSRDLDGYRYLSVDTCRRVIRDLLEAGVLIEAEPPKAIRVKRSWRTVPRVFEVPPELAAPEHRQKTSRKRRVSA